MGPPNAVESTARYGQHGTPKTRQDLVFWPMSTSSVDMTKTERQAESSHVYGRGQNPEKNRFPRSIVAKKKRKETKARHPRVHAETCIIAHPS